jgi:hypothetical protein
MSKHLPGDMTRVSTVAEIVWARQPGSDRAALVVLTGSHQDAAIAVLVLLQGVASMPEAYGERASTAARKYLEAVGYSPKESIEVQRVGPDIIAEKP